MVHSKMMLIIGLFSVVSLQAVGPETLERVEKEKKEEKARQKMPQLLEQLPPDLRREILKINAKSEVLNIPALAQGLTTLAATSKSLHAAINNPVNMLLILKSLPKAGAKVLAQGLRNMPGMQSKEVRDWLNSLELVQGSELYSAIGILAPINKILENPNIDVNWKSDRPISKGDIPLIFASSTQQPIAVKALLNAGADVNQKGFAEQTALMYASQNGNAVIVKLLLAAGANPLLQDDAHRTAIHKASEHAELTEAHIKAIRQEGGDVQRELEQQKKYNEIIKLLEDAEKAQKEKAARK